MKVCMMTTSYPRSNEDASGIFIARLCRALAASSVEVDVVAPADSERPGFETTERIIIHRFRYFFPERWQRLAYGSGGGIPANLRRSRWLLFQVPFFLMMFMIEGLRVSKGADVVHANWIYSGFVALVVKGIRGIPFVVTLRGSDVQRAQEGRFAHFLSLWILRKATAITTVNQHLKSWVIAQGIPEDRVLFIRNGVDRPNYGRSKSCTPQCRLLFVGSLIPRKGVKYLIEALAHVVLEEKDVSLTLIGEGKEKEALLKQIHAHALDDVVTFKGAQPPDQILGWMNKADCLVLPSLWEGTPNVILEAMSSGLPVVASDLPGIREIVHPGVNGYLSCTKNVEDLSKNILLIIRDEKGREQMGKSGQDLITKLELGWEQTAKRYQECYAKTCAVSQASII